MTERKVLVSADSSGVFGTPDLWKQLWGFALKENRGPVCGFEAIGWSWIDYLVRKAQKEDLEIVGIHGRTGGIHDGESMADRLVLGFLQRILIPTPDLIQKFAGGKVDYVLLHAPELRQRTNFQSAVENKTKLEKTTLFVEGHIRRFANMTAYGAVLSLRYNGVNAGVMLDLAHETRSLDHNGDFNGRWNEVLALLDKLFKSTDLDDKKFPIGVHIPVGTNPLDSLPLDEMTDVHWRSLAGVLDGQQTLIVIENQELLPGIIRPFGRALHDQVERNKRIIETLKRTGVI